MPQPSEPNHSNKEIRPSAGLAEYAKVSQNYSDFIFPTGKMVQVHLPTASPPVTDITPTALVSAQANPVEPSIFNSSEQDVLFSRHLLTKHKVMDKGFHVDWGSNIIIVNSQDAFIELTTCDEQIHPIDGIPVKGIKGYGTVIFQFGSQLLPVRDIAFMPNNPQSTFTSSHLQRMNSFLPGIHALHSSVKVIDRNGVTTKSAPTKKWS